MSPYRFFFLWGESFWIRLSSDDDNDDISGRFLSLSSRHATTRCDWISMLCIYGCWRKKYFLTLKFKFWTQVCMVCPYIQGVYVYIIFLYFSTSVVPISRFFVSLHSFIRPSGNSLAHSISPFIHSSFPCHFFLKRCWVSDNRRGGALPKNKNKPAALSLSRLFSVSSYRWD